MKQIILIIAILVAIPIFGEKILILKSKNLTTYDNLVTGFSIDSKSETTVLSLDNPKNSSEVVLSRIRSEFDLVFAIGDLALKVATKQSNKPVIFAMVLNYKKYSPDINQVTGIKMNLSVKTQLSVISSLFAPSKNIGVITSSDLTNSKISGSQQIASLFGLKLIPIEISSGDDLKKVLSANSSKFEVLWMIPDRVILNPVGFNTLSKFSSQNKKPLYVLSSGLVEKGGLFSLSPDYLSVGKQASRIANKILFSKVPVKFIPISDPDSFYLTLNYSIAKKINIVQELAPKLLNFSATKGFKIEVVK